MLSQFGKRLNACRKCYEGFVRAGRGEGYREEFHGGVEDQRVLGSDQFVEKMLGTEVLPSYKGKQIQLIELVRHICKKYQLKEEDLTSTDR